MILEYKIDLCNIFIISWFDVLLKLLLYLTSFYATNWCIKTITYFKINVGSKKSIAVFWKTRSQTKEAAAFEILKEEFDFCYLLPCHCFSFLGQSKGGKSSNRFLKAKTSKSFSLKRNYAPHILGTKIFFKKAMIKG